MRLVRWLDPQAGRWWFGIGPLSVDWSVKYHLPMLEIILGRLNIEITWWQPRRES